MARKPFSRKPFIAGNWKMHKTIEESRQLAAGLKNEVAGLTDKVTVVLGPVFTALSAVADEVRGTDIGVAAQNMCWEREGAYTGEISPYMIKDAGAAYVILGHSERRQYARESDALINQKVKLALAEGLKPIVCVGETLAEREGNKTARVVKKQVKGVLEGLTAEQMASVVIAYEPVWAIGTGKVATKEQAQEVHLMIRKLVRKLFDKDVAKNAIILYGGSVKPENTAELMSQPDVDGALVGGASLKADSFAAIVKNAVND